MDFFFRKILPPKRGSHGFYAGCAAARLNVEMRSSGTSMPYWHAWVQRCLGWEVGGGQRLVGEVGVIYGYIQSCHVITNLWISKIFSFQSVSFWVFFLPPLFQKFTSPHKNPQHVFLVFGPRWSIFCMFIFGGCRFFSSQKISKWGAVKLAWSSWLR